MHCDFVRIRQTLRVTPAMAVGIIDRHPDLEDMAVRLEPAISRETQSLQDKGGMKRIGANTGFGPR